MHGTNLGTVLRTCDAVGACLAVPPFRWVDEALARGNTLRRPSCVHRIGDPAGWLLARLSCARCGDVRVIACRLTAVVVTLREITDENRAAIIALRVAPQQERFVGPVRDALADAARYPHANPWYRSVYVGDEPVGFVMLSWNVSPKPPDIIGPWFLWKLIIDQRYQGCGYGAETVRRVAALVRAEGATQLLTSYVLDEGGPAGFYRRLGFVPTGELDGSGEVIVRLVLSEV
jgi:GNAT superfamily N-acetyltransferase